MGKRRRDPTQEDEEKEYPLLEEKYKQLEEHWNMTCKQSNPCRHDKVLRRCSSSSISSVDQLFNKYSPRELMSSLQVKRRPPSEGRGYMMMFNSKVREENDDMLVELLRDRLSAIQSGKLKGRRLFQDSDDDDDDDDDDLDGEEICGDCFDLIITQQSEQLKSVVSSYASDHEIINDGCTSGGIFNKEGDGDGDGDGDEFCSPSSSSTSSSSSSSLVISNEKLVEREKVKVVVAVEGENSVAGEKINIGKGGRVKNNNNNMPHVAMAWLGIVLMLFVVIWTSCNRWYVGTEDDDDDFEVFLVPT